MQEKFGDFTRIMKKTIYELRVCFSTYVNNGFLLRENDIIRDKREFPVLYIAVQLRNEFKV